MERGKCWENLRNAFIGQGAVRQWENGAKDVLDAQQGNRLLQNEEQTLRAGYPMQIVCVGIMGPLPETDKEASTS